MMPIYFDVPDVPGRYFSCVRYGTMSVSACARNFSQAPAAASSGRLQACLGCRVGAGHAGVVPSSIAEQLAGQAPYWCACLRCRRSGREITSRLIGRMRLVREHTICVSCYNREREVLHGANAKGATPKKWSGLYMLESVYLQNGAAVRDKLAMPVLDRIEAILTVLRLKNSPGVMWTSPTIVRAAEA